MEHYSAVNHITGGCVNGTAESIMSGKVNSALSPKLTLHDKAHGHGISLVSSGITSTTACHAAELVAVTWDRSRFMIKPLVGLLTLTVVEQPFMRSGQLDVIGITGRWTVLYWADMGEGRTLDAHRYTRFQVHPMPSGIICCRRP